MRSCFPTDNRGPLEDTTPRQRLVSTGSPSAMAPPFSAESLTNSPNFVQQWCQLDAESLSRASVRPALAFFPFFLVIPSQQL